MKSPSFHGYSSGMPKIVVKYFTFLIFVLFSLSMFSQQLAFPTAKGAASYVTGGRGHSVYHVTNLNNSGTGSFRDATSSSNRIIVFDVSGTIELSSDLYIDSDNLTIAGQSAPHGGITITGAAVHFQNVNNIILRYLRFRPDYNSSGSVDALNAYSCTNFIVDHCSISWGGDEAFSITGTSSDVTVQNCISGESATGMLVGHSSSSTSSNFSIIGNLWYNISHRFPNVHALRTDLINNVVHNWFTRLKEVNASHTVDLNEINNYYQSGNKTGAPLSPNWSINWLESGKTFRVYTDGNVRTGYLTEAGDDWTLYVDRATWIPSDPNFQEFTPFSLLGEAPTITSAAEALINVPLNAGANKYLNSDGSVGEYRDDVDALYVTNVANGISEGYSYPPTDIVNKQSYIDFHNSVSNTPINVRPSNYDTNNDGMPDAWKTIKGFGVNEDLDSYEWPSGYIGIEEFLNEIDGETNNNSQVNAGSDQSICEGEEVVLTASGSVSYLWSNSETSANITVSPTETTSYTVTGTDSEGIETTDSVTVTVNPIPQVFAGNDEEICDQDSVTLTANGGSNYEWSTGETSQSINVSPQDTTIYTVTVTLNGCSSTDEVVVTVKPRPTISAGNDVDIYQNESITLTAIGDGNFVWSTGEETNTITVSPTETTTYTVTAELNGCTNTDSVTVSIIQETIEANAGEDVTICEGENVTLTASGGTNYLWSTGETTQSIEVSPTETSTYTVTVSNDTNSDTDDVIVNVNPSPTINAGNDVDIYLGESVTLTAVGEGTFEWNTGETIESITVSPTETTTYIVTAELNGCTNSDSVTVSIIEQESIQANAGEDTTICSGENVTLTASGGTNYLWSTGETTQSIEVNPTETTTYTVTVSNDTDTDTDDVIVNVNPSPIANAGDDQSILHGQAVTLSASGGSEYIWSTGETTQQINVHPTENTTYTVEVIQDDCSDFDSVEILVNVLASVVDDTEICQGTSTTLTASGGSNYIWSNGETTQSIEVSPTQTTTYTVIVSNGTSSDAASVTVSVNLLPNADAGEDVTIEAGQNVTLSASGGNTYVWNTGDTSQNISVNPTETTTYTVETIINGCSNYDEVTVTVVDPVNADAGDDVEICIGDEITLTASGGEFFEWSTGDTTASINVAPESTTMYSVSVSNGISEESAEVMVILDNCLDSENEEDQFFGFDYKVYPNPSNGEVNIKLSGLENISSLYITDILGKTIKTETIPANNGSIINMSYNLSSISKGMYFVTFVQSGKEAITKKLIIN